MANPFPATMLAEKLEVSSRAVQLRAVNDSWPYVERAVRGGRERLYLPSAMPEPARVALAADLPNAETTQARVDALKAVVELTKTLGSTRAREAVARKTGCSVATLYRWEQQVAGKPEEEWLALLAGKELALLPEDDFAPLPEELKDWQRQAVDARLAIVREVEQRAVEMGMNKAVAQVVKEANRGALPDMLQDLVSVANARSGKAARLSRNTIYRWRAAAAQGLYALAPKGPANEGQVPAWAGLFLDCYRVPSKVSVAQAIEEMAEKAPPHLPLPTEGQARRFLKKLSRVDAAKGRMSGPQLRAVKGFIRRDTTALYPNDVWTCDGHSFKARVAHPAHARPFHPEVCAVIDVAIRRVMGWSAGLAESAHTVAGGLAHAIEHGGIPAIFYTDGGAGNTAKQNADPVVGIFARFGIDHRTGRPGNPQGRGLIERANKEIWIRAAKTLPSYTGKDMDKTTARNVYLITEKDVKRQGRSDLLISWVEFLALCQQYVDAYNNRPHSELPKITDPVTGKKRHASPNEMLAYYIAQGWRPERLRPEEVRDIFRPCIIRTVQRCEVTDPCGNRFYSKELTDYHRMKVRVHYDIHDPSQVWVRDMDERLICIARWEANKRDYFAISEVENAREQRAARRIALKEQQIELIEAERRGAMETVAPQQIELTKEQEAAAAKLMEAPKGAALPANDHEKYEMLLAAKAAGQPIRVEEADWMEAYERRLFAPRRVAY